MTKGATNVAQRQVIRDRQQAIERACGLINRAAELAGAFPAHPEDCICECGVAARAEKRGGGWQFRSEGYGAELIERLLDEYEQRINEENEERVTMRLADWWDGLDELDDAGNRRDDSLWEPPVVDYEITGEASTGITAAQAFDGAEDEPCWDDEVPR